MEITGEYSPTTEFFSGVHSDLTSQNTGDVVYEFGILFESYNSAVPFTVGASSVPEPSIGAMFLMACLGCSFMRRSK
jgi:hypothetical protein